MHELGSYDFVFTLSLFQFAWSLYNYDNIFRKLLFLGAALKSFNIYLMHNSTENINNNIEMANLLKHVYEYKE